MFISSNIIDNAFDNLAQRNIDSKFFGILFLLKNIVERRNVQTDLGSLDLAVYDKSEVEKDLRKYFSFNEPDERDVEPNHDMVLFKENFSEWVYSSILNERRIDSFDLAVFLFRNRSFANDFSCEELKQELYRLLNLPVEHRNKWFNDAVHHDVVFEQARRAQWPHQIQVENRTYSFSPQHKSIVFKSPNNLYSVVAAPEELSRGPFFQPLYSAQKNALLLINSEFFQHDNADLDINQNEHTEQVNNNQPVQYSQIIYYGVPGCGKSNKIKDLLQNVPEYNKIRVVFHPEYTNADFVGQIMPVVNNGIHYDFTPGPFSQILKRAYLKPSDHFYLVIEEINRGNAAAIFGDTFQLLDRLKAGETDALGNDQANAHVNTFTEGWSQYFVQNADLNAYIRKATQRDNGSYDENNDGNPLDHIQIGNISFDSNTAIRIPPNLSILATMNTSDQNVFTLDNAFQRRFDMELVRNEFEKGEDANQYEGYKTEAIQNQHNAVIAGTNVSWGFFWEWINGKITTTLKGLKSTEDKRLGVWFVSNVNCVIDHKVFAEKVLKYLWDDVFKFKRSEIFADGIDTLEKLIKKFEEPEEGETQFAVFKNFLNEPNPGAV